MTALALPFGASADRRPPNVDELVNGYPCGPADRRLDNWLEWFTTAQMANVMTKSGWTPDDTDVERLFVSMRSQKGNYRTAGGTANSLTATFDPAPSSLAILEGTPIRLKIATTNTSGTVFLNVNSLGAVPVRRPGGSAPAIGDLAQDMIATFVYNNSVFMITSVTAASGVVPGSTGFVAYDTAGTYTFTVPAGVWAIECGGVGGGGGGAGASAGVTNAGTGGGAGGFAWGWYPVTPGQSVTVVLGAGGAGGPGPAGGGVSGGTTSVGSFITAPGGGGGNPNGVSGGSSGTGSGGQINSSGGGGASAEVIAGALRGGEGGGSWFGSGGLTNGGVGAPPGTGGGGASGSNPGGAGRAGYAWIRY